MRARGDSPSQTASQRDESARRVRKGSAQEDGCEGGLAKCTIIARALTSAMATLVTERGRSVSADVQGSMSGFGCPVFICSELRFVRFGWPPRGSAVAVLQAGVSNARGAGGATGHEERRPSRPSKFHLNNPVRLRVLPSGSATGGLGIAPVHGGQRTHRSGDEFEDSSSRRNAARNSDGGATRPAQSELPTAGKLSRSGRACLR
jgi:hypothetical protein